MSDFSASFTLNGRAYRASSDVSFSYDPLSFGLVINAPLGIKLSDTFTYDAANSLPKTNNASLAWGPPYRELGGYAELFLYNR